MCLAKVAVLGLGGILAVWGQTVTVEPGQISGVELVTPQSAEFQHLFQDAAEPQDTSRPAAWLPFTVILRNHSTRAVVAYRIRWAVDGEIRWMASERNVGTSLESTGDPSDWLKPGDAVVVAPGAASPFVTLPGGAGQSLLTALQNAGTVAISVDSVLFADGQFAGPDLARNFERDAATFAATRALNAEVGTALASGESWNQIAARLDALANRTQSGSLDWNARARESQARVLLRRYRKGGAPAVAAFVQEALAQPEIVVHR